MDNSNNVYKIISERFINKLARINQTADLSFKTLNSQTLKNFILKAQLLGYKIEEYDDSYVVYNNKTITVLSTHKFKVVNGNGLFSDSYSNNIDLSQINMVDNNTLEKAFLRCKSKEIKLNNINTSNVKSMQSMFNSCSIGKLDLSSFNTSKVTDMSYMFWHGNWGYVDLSSFIIKEDCNTKYMFSSECVGKLRLPFDSYSANRIKDEIHTNSSIEIVGKHYE